MDQLFEKAAPKTKKLSSSTVSRARPEGNIIISTNTDDSKNATHLIKIEIYDLEKLRDVPLEQHWKHADYRLKYYTMSNTSPYDATKQILMNITKEIAGKPSSKKYCFKNDDK